MVRLRVLDLGSVLAARVTDAQLVAVHDVGRL